MKKLLSSLLIALCFGVAFTPARADDLCRNLFDKETMWVKSAYIRAGNPSTELPLGSENPASGWSCTDYIRVEPNTTYTMTRPSAIAASAAGLVFYSDTTVESAIRGITSSANTNDTFTTPANCHYVRFSWMSTTNGNAQLEKGSTATSYVPYNPLCATCDGTVKQSPNLYKPSARSQYTSKGVTISVDEEGLLHLDGSTTETQTIVLSAYTSSFANGYTISANVLSGTITGGASSIYPNSNGNYSPAVYFGTYKTSTYTGNLGAIYITLRTGDTFDNAVIGIQILDGIATSIPTYHPYGSTYCEHLIKIATTAYNAARFSPVVNDLNSTVATIRDIVTNTINQTAAIASLQADKQTRPEDACPAGKKCLLVETEENGVIVPHWFPIIEAPE